MGRTGSSLDRNSPGTPNRQGKVSISSLGAVQSPRRTHIRSFNPLREDKQVTVNPSRSSGSTPLACCSAESKKWSCSGKCQGGSHPQSRSKLPEQRLLQRNQLQKPKNSTASGQQAAQFDTGQQEGESHRGAGRGPSKSTEMWLFTSRGNKGHILGHCGCDETCLTDREDTTWPEHQLPGA